MQVVFAIAFITGAVALWIAWLANRRTALAHALAWATAAWLAWGWASFVGFADLNARADLGRYVALCLTGCAAVAVLGARRPGVAAWNFVVLGLLAILLLPLAD